MSNNIAHSHIFGCFLRVGYKSRGTRLRPPPTQFEPNRSSSRILIGIPELEHGVTHRKQRKAVSSKRQQTHVFAESYQTV